MESIATIQHDISHERLIPLTQVGQHLPSVFTSGEVPLRTIRHWGKRGVRGVKLETLRIGGRQFTSIEAIGRFCSRIND